MPWVGMGIEAMGIEAKQMLAAVQHLDGLKSKIDVIMSCSVGVALL